MSIARRVLTLVLAALGVYYAAQGVVTLVDLLGVTARWIERSNDRDFRHDIRVFTALIGIGAVAVAGLGLATVVRGYRDLTGGRRSPWWGALFIASVLVHAPAFVYKVVSGGILPTDEFRPHVLGTAARFLLTSVAFGVAWWFAVRERRTTTSPAPSSHSVPRPS